MSEWGNPVGTRVRIWSPTPPSCIVRGDKMGQPVCRGLRPVSVDEGILEVEDNWVSADPMFHYTSLAWISPRQVVVLARYYQSACQRKH